LFSTAIFSEHEDGGLLNIIQVVQPTAKKGDAATPPNWERPDFNGRRPIASDICDDESSEEQRST
jgi:hypothetical protein